MFGEPPTCLLANTKRVCLFFSLSNGFFFWPLFRKAQVCGVYGLKWSLKTKQLSKQVRDKVVATTPCSSWCFLLGVAPCFVVLQTLGPFRTSVYRYIYIYWDHVTDHVTLRLHTWGLFKTNYVTSESNWLHHILFRGFIARTTFPLLIHLHFLKTSYFLNFTSPNWTILCMSIRLNPNKNPFKLQVVTQQNRKNDKGDEYFCKALYLPREFPTAVYKLAPGYKQAGHHAPGSCLPCCQWY
jgi:hypothetical protein